MIAGSNLGGKKKERVNLVCTNEGKILEPKNIVK